MRLTPSQHRPMSSPASEYNFNFPPPPSYGPPGAPVGHTYGGMVGPRETGIAGYLAGGPGGMMGIASRPISVPPITPGLSSAEFERPASVIPVIDPRLAASGGAGISGLTQSNGGSQKSLKISQVLSEMTTMNRRLAHAENLELQHAQELYALEARCTQQVEAAKNELKAEIKSLEELFEQKVASLLASKSRGDAREGSDIEMDEVFEKDVEKVEKSALAFGDNGLKAVVRIVFQMLMGIAKLTVDVLPPYPSDVNNWPLDPATKEHLMRFRWAESHQHSDNHANILRIIAYIRQNGATVCAGSGPAVRDISDEDLHARVVKKYQDLQKNMRKAGKLSTTMTATTTATDSAENAPSAAAVITTTSRSKLQSRARGKLEVRVRKFENLPEASEFADQKYRAALTESLMSQDEDEVDEKGQKTGRFMSHAGTYRSDLMSRFLAAVDEVVDPHPPPRFTVRVKGDPKDLPLLAAKKIENKARRWMISADWLANPENKKYDSPGFILDNGRAWGDPKDPEEMLVGQKRVKEQKRLIASKKRVKIEEIEAKKKENDKGKGKGKVMNEKGKERETLALVQPVASTSRVQLPAAAESDDDFSD